MRKKKILRILNRFNVGGPIYNAAYLTKYIDNEKYETLLIGGQWESHENDGTYILRSEEINYKLITRMRRSISIYNDIISLFQVISIMYKFKPDIIHTHAAKAGIIGRIAALFYFRKAKVIHTYHGNVFEGYFSSFLNKIILNVERILAKKTNKIIAISNLQKNDLISKYRICKESKIEVVKLGFDLSKFQQNTTSKRNKIRAKYNISDEEILILIVGRIVPVKNHKFFIDVFSKCKIKSNKKIKAMVIGDGNLTNELVEYAKSKNLITNYKKLLNRNFDIMFCSWIKDIDYYLSASDINVLTSINEGTPVSIIESMVNGTASISTNVGGVSDIIQNKFSGIVSELDVVNFSEDLLNLIEDDLFRKKLSLNGKKILETYSYKRLVKDIELMYDNL